LQLQWLDLLLMWLQLLQLLQLLVLWLWQQRVHMFLL